MSLELSKPRDAAWFSAEDQVAFRDFYVVYESNYDAIQAETLAVALDHPDFGPLIKTMPADQMAAQNARSRSLLAAPPGPHRGRAFLGTPS
jgi:hypothetical protein